MSRNPRILPACLLLLLLAGCTSVRSLWPFGARAAPAPQAVSELVVAAPDPGAAMVLQYWERNTLVVDLSAVAGEGRLTLSRQQGRSWPMRMAFRMQPGRFAMLEVRGAQRVAWPVASTADAAVVVDLPASAYEAGTPELVVRWGAAGN